LNYNEPSLTEKDAEVRSVLGVRDLYLVVFLSNPNYDMEFEVFSSLPI
jgi:hypothetical protein